MQKALDKLKTIFELVDECLNEWNKEGNLQVPQLLAMMAAKASLDDKTVKSYNHIVRFYLRENENWKITRGAHGGIIPIDKKSKKELKLLKKKEESKDSKKQNEDE